jgi:uncharacterized repeat protein (TIGR01451 family)
MSKAFIVSGILNLFQVSKERKASKRFASRILGVSLLTMLVLVAGCTNTPAPSVPVVTTNPTNVTVTAGATASFTAAATGTPTPTVQWMVNSGSGFTAVAGATSTTLSFTTTAAQTGNTYEAVFTNTQGSATTTAATLTVNTLPAITTNPTNVSVLAGATATFTAAATGSPAPTVQWQVSTNGGTTFTNTNLPGSTTTTLSFPTTAAQNANQFKAVFTNAAGSTSTTAATLTVLAPALSIVKSHTGNFTVGTNGVFTIAVSNSGNSPTTGSITVTDTLATGLTFVSGTGTNWVCAAVLQVVTCTNAGPIAAASAAGNITLTVGVALNAPASIGNTALAATTGSASASSTDTVTVVSPDLAIAVSHSGGFTAGQNGVFTIAVNNVGTAPTSGAITVTDTLDNNFSFVSATGTGWACGNVAQLVTCTNAGPIANGASAGSITLTVLVSAAASGNLSDTAVVATAGDNNAVNNTSTNTVAITAAPDLAIVKTGSSLFVAGSNATFQLAVSNVSTGPTVGVITVTDTLNANFTFVSGTGAGWACSAVLQLVTCTNPGPIAGSASAANIVLTVAVNAAATGSISNTATVQTTDDNNAANNSSTATVTVTAAAPDLSITKTVSGAFVAGANGVFNIAVNNIGTASTTGTITVTDALNSAFTFVSGTGTNWTCAAVLQLVTCTNPGPVANGSAAGNITLTVAISGAASGSIANTANVSDAGDTTDVLDKASTVNANVGAANPCASLPSGNESLLHGQYAILLNGWQGSGNGTPVAMAASVAADGTGKISSLNGGIGGNLDVNTVSGPQSVTITPSGAGIASKYQVGPATTGTGFLGCMTVATSNPGITVTFTFSLGGVVSGVASKGRIIEFDDTTGAGTRVAGELLLQDPTAFSAGNTSALHTNYAFGADGQTNAANGHFAIAGSFVLNPTTGAFTSANLDVDAGGLLGTNLSGTGSIPFSSISAVDGRGTSTLNFTPPTGPVASTSAIYIVNANEFFTLGTDSFNAGFAINAGRAIVSASSYTSINPQLLLHITSSSPCGSGGGTSVPCAQVTLGLLNITATNNTSGTFTGDIYNYDPVNGAQSQNFPSSSPATYTLTNATGRVAIGNAGGNAPVVYLASPATNTDPFVAFLVGTDTSAIFGFGETGAASAITTASLAGNYFFGDDDPGDNTVKNQVGIAVFAANGTITGTGLSSGQGGLNTASSVNGTVTITNVGSASNPAPGTGNIGTQTIAITNGKRFFFIDESGGAAVIRIVELQ